MKATDRRDMILQTLQKADEEISATSLATTLKVSRQIIVGDIALLRAAGEDIISTPRGYVLSTHETRTGEILRQIACVHNEQQMLQELQICVDQGCSILNVIVEHPVYGQITGQLMLKSRYDIDQFMEKVKAADAHSLSELTDGVHIHTLSCPSQAAYERVCESLKAAGILFKQ
ncbi:MAG: transcription repressor NadR [Sphaerochaetaceae bacterium]|nr:transcription repressor NadR [Sphaerochaetaceae bacterium]